MTLQVSDVLKEFEIGQSVSDQWMAQQNWVNKWTKVDLRTAYERSRLFYFAFDPENPNAPQYWGDVLGRGDSFIRVLQDGLNELARRVLPFSYGILQTTGTYDCPTAALATIARYWYRRDIALPLPSTSELQWPELLLAFQMSPAMHKAIEYRWQNPTVQGTNIPAYYLYRWIIPDPARQYTPPPMPSGCASMRPEVQGFAETMGPTPGPQTMLPFPEFPPLGFPEFPEVPGIEPIGATTTTEQPTSDEPSWLRPVGITALLGIAGYVAWTLVKEK